MIHAHFIFKNQQLEQDVNLWLWCFLGSHECLVQFWNSMAYCSSRRKKWGWGRWSRKVGPNRTGRAVSNMLHHCLGAGIFRPMSHSSLALPTRIVGWQHKKVRQWGRKARAKAWRGRCGGVRESNNALSLRKPSVSDNHWQRPLHDMSPPGVWHALLNSVMMPLALLCDRNWVHLFPWATRIKCLTLGTGHRDVCQHSKDGVPAQ